MRRLSVILLVAGLAILGLPGEAAGGTQGDWTAPDLIPASLPDRPAVAVNRDGTAVLAFANRRGAWLARIDARGRLGRARRIPGPRPTPDSAAVALADSGQVTVAWHAAKPSRLVVASWRLGRSPAPGVTMSTGEPTYFALAAGRRGATIAWSETFPDTGPASVTIAAASIRPGVRASPATLATLPSGLVGSLFIGIDGGDRATVAWIAGFRAPALTTVDSGASDRFAPEAPPRTHVLDQAPLEDLQVLTDARGRQIAVWWTGDPLGAGRIMAARRDRGEAFLPAHVVATGRRLTGLDAALGAGGRAGATWSAQGRQHPVFAALASSAGAWRKPQTLTAPGRSGEQPQIEIDGEGQAVALWGGLQGMRAATASARGALSGRGLISARRLCSSTQLVMARSGKAVATFICSRPRRYEPPGSDVRPLHEVARYQP